MEVEDRISNLPAHVIEQILSELPIKDAVRTSVLSSKWRYKWARLSNLVFDNQCVSASSHDQAFVRNKLVSIVDHVLLLHIGPVYKFKLSHRDLLSVNDIDRWILYLLRNSIKEFVLEIWKGQHYKMPSSLFSCQHLTHLELFNCLLTPPPMFKGFRSLTSLDLQYVTLAQDAFEKLICNCPLLERLTLMNFDGFTRLNIDAPNLQFFDVGGVFEDVNFKNTSHLTVVSIGLYVNVANNSRRTLSSSSNMIKFFTHLPNIRRLEVQNYFLKYLAVGVVPGKLPRPCLHLEYLSIRINFNDLEEILMALWLLRISPNIQELEILVRPEESGVLLAPVTKIIMDEWYRERWDCLFSLLQLVKISGIRGVKLELDFINFLLLSSPMLEKMIIKPASVNDGWELAKELLRFRRASARAEIIYLDPYSA